MGDFQQVLQVIPPSPVINYPTHPRVVVVPPFPPVITYSTLTAPVVPTVAVERMTSVNIPAMPTAGSPPLSINALTPLSTFGLINPLITMQTKDQPYYIPFSYLSSLQKQDPLTVSTLNAQIINTQTVNAVSSFVGTSYTVSSFFQNISTNYIEAFEAYVYDKLTLDNQVLTANSTDLLLNGIPIATTANLSSIADWAYDPAVSTIQANGNDLTNVRFANFSSIIADGLTVVKLTTLFSTTIEVFESTITSETQKLTVSSITGGNGSFDILTANTFINPAASTINCQFLNVSSNANMLNATFSNAPTFNQGGTFNGTRPNFNTGINTSGANNFNNTNIDNASNINGNVITIAPQNNLNINTSNAVATVVDRGVDVGGSAVIGLTARFGGGSQINLNANSASVLALTPTSAINLDAQGNVGGTSGIPFGGAINLTARAGLSGAGTSVAGGGGINLTAFSYGGIAPGTIKESAGSILSYSGLTVPSVGVLGSGFYSALNCLSLTAGASPATTSFPGVVFLRGDNGTKVENGFFTDTITATGNSTLPTITGVTSINGSAYPPTSGSGVWCSTATTALNMAGFGINGVSNISGNSNLRINGLVTTSNSSNWTNGSVNTLYGSEVLSGKYISWSYDNNPGTGIYDNCNISVSSQTVSITGTNTIAITSPGTNFYGAVGINGNDLYMNSNRIYDVSVIQNGSGDLSINIPNQTYFNNGGFVQFNVNHIRMFAGYLDMMSNDITNVRTLSALSTQQITINQTSGSDFVLFNNGDTRMLAKRDAYVQGDRNVIIDGLQDTIVRGQNQAVVESPGGYINLVAQGGSNTVYLTAANTEVRGNMGFTPSNAYINNLGHIYGSLTAPGNGLAIDYMYYIGFNGSGRNASIYIDAGNLNMNNFNTGINIGNYNAFGTGNMNITSQNNDVYINAPTRNIYLNATTGVAMNSGGAQIAIAGDNNIYFTGNGGGGTTRYANFQDTNVAFNTGTPGSLLMNMNGNRIIRVGDLNRLLGTADVRTPVIQYGTVATSGGSGSIVVNIPNAYTSISTYIALVTMEDTSPAQMSVQKINASRIEIYWANAGGGAHSIVWSCQGE